METKRLPVAKTAGAILLMALSTNTLAAYYCNPNGGGGGMVCQGTPDYPVAPKSFFHQFMDARERTAKMFRDKERAPMEQRLMQQEIELRQQQLELRQLELEQKRRQRPEEHSSQADKQLIHSPIFGARVVPLPDEFYGRSQGNTGAFVETVAQGGPAFKANIMRGDVIIRLDGWPVDTAGELVNILPKYAGQKVPVKIIRGTRTLDIDVQLSEGY